MEVYLWEYFLLVFAILFASVAYYIITHRKPVRPWYMRSERDWRNRVPKDEDIIFTTFLIGDAGANTLANPEPTLEILRSQLLEYQEKSAVFFLGDNIYPHGLPEPTHPTFSKSVDHLLSQLHVVDNYKGRICMISGNHDWNKGRKGGLRAVLRQQDFVDDYFARDDIFLPRNGCPGPVELELTPNLTAVVINTQWWVHSGKRPIGPKDGCEARNERHFFEVLQRVLEKNKNKNILVIAHHPLYSKAYHGGKFGLKQHLFPLTDLHKKAYVPLPVAGSLYPMYRRYIGAAEDISHPRYRKMKRQLLKIFHNYPNLVYAAGHDHNLQYIKKHLQHYIVSGSGSKVTYVHRGKGTTFAHAHKGFFKINYLQNGEVWAEAWEPEVDKSARLSFRTKMYG